MPNTTQSALLLYQAGEYQAVLDQYGVLAQEQDCPQLLLVILAQSHLKLGNPLRAARHFRRAGETEGGNNLNYYLLAGTIFLRHGAVSEAYAIGELLRDLAPEDPKCMELFYRTLNQTCLFDEIDAEYKLLLERLRNNEDLARRSDNPLNNITWCGDEEINASIIPTAISNPVTTGMQFARRSRPHDWADRIRVGYLSDDFYDQHPVMHLMQGVFACHDRDRFDITLFCYTSAENIATDTGNRKHYPNLVSIAELDDAAAADLIRSRSIDVLVDLKGHTAGARPNLINLGLAPVQAAYLGFPGPALGIDCDYTISDWLVTPDTSKPFYREKLCRLPECYQANDDVFRAIPEPRSRELLGLPEDKFIFAFFNATRKITPETFRLTMDILRSVENSVLWILIPNRFARENFISAVAAADIDPARIIFASASPYIDHVSRLGAADLGLDTFPYNGHTTTSDALWAGLPVITKRGTHFASRVSESLLVNIGMGELVAADSEAYIALARSFATDPVLREKTRQKLALNRESCSLFDTKRFTKHLERAYDLMIARARQGLAPEHIDVDALSGEN